MPRFSIIIPYHNRRNYLERVLRSVVAQSWRPLEVVLVDNASSDDSAAVCQQFAAAHTTADLRFVCVGETRRGAAAARNRGLAAASGDWIYFFDSDDELSPNFFTDVAAALAAHLDASVVACATRMIFADGREQVRWVCRSGDVADHILSGMLSTQAVVMRRELLERIGAWDATLHYWDDWELGTRLLCAHPRVVWLSQAYHRLYQHEDSITGSSFSARQQQAQRVFVAVARTLSAMPPSRERRRAVLALQARRAIFAGHLRREGVRLADIGMTVPGGVVRLVYYYARYGGRGAARLFQTALRIFCCRRRM